MIAKISMVRMVGKFLYGLMPDGTPQEAQHLARRGVLDSLPQFKQVSHEQLDVICNGCGQSDAIFDFVPDSFWFLYIGHACMIHDYEYEIGITAEDRLAADERWLRNMKEIIYLDDAWWRWDWKLNKNAQFYYDAVRYAGKSAFHNKKLLSNQLMFNKLNGLDEDTNVDENTIIDC